MGKFTDTKYTSTVDSLIKGAKNKINNPYYVFSDKKPTKVDYYSQSKEASTLDDSSKTYYADSGTNSPIQYNRIKDFYLYGIDRINPTRNTTEFGTEADPIEGEAIFLPNTIAPVPGDHFTILQTKEKLLFKITDVQVDTLESGANIYKASYKLFNVQIDTIEINVVKEFKFLVTNIGTDFKTIIEAAEFDLLSTLENLNISIVEYFNELFFDKKVQSYIYRYNGYLMYDPYFVEFLRRNDVLSADKYTYVAHQTFVPKTFSLNYSKTFFAKIEECELNDLDSNITACAKKITDLNSLFVTRLEPYYQIEYGKPDFAFITQIPIFKGNVIDRILKNEYVDDADVDSIFNIWVAYFNNDKDYISGHILNLIKNFDYQDNKDCFYSMAITVFIISKYIRNVLS